MTGASEFASLIATRPDHGWQGPQTRRAIRTYADSRRQQPDQEPELAAILYFTLIEITARVEKHELGEQGRRLASERDDLIAQGANPADLAIPIHPDDVRSDQ